MGWKQLVPVVARKIPRVKASCSVKKSGDAVLSLVLSAFYIDGFIDAKHDKADCFTDEDGGLVRVHFHKDGAFQLHRFKKGGARILMPPICDAMKEDRELVSLRIVETTTDSFTVEFPDEWVSPSLKQPPPKPAQMPEASVPGNGNSMPGGKLDPVVYLKGKGRKCSRLAGGRYQLDGEIVMLDTLAAVVNAYRKAVGVSALTVSQLQS